MDLSALRALALTLNFSAHGVAATVTRPGLAAVTTSLIWQTPPVDADQPPAFGGRDFQRREPRRVAVLPRDVLPTMPDGTTIVAPEKMGGTNVTWKMDGLDRTEADHWRVFVRRV